MAAQLHPIDLITPGTLGVNFEQRDSQLGPEWATRAHEAILDASGRLASRGGYSSATSEPIDGEPLIRSLHEYVRDDGTSQVILAWDGGIANNIDDPEANDISGSVQVGDGNWWFQNFVDEVWGFQHDKEPIIFDGSGDFTVATASQGTMPTVADGVALSAFGRLWVLDQNRQVVKFSGLLDGTDWGGVGSGEIDMRNLWTGGTDVVTALVAFNGRLVIFGHNHIIMFDDGVGSPLGLDPSQMVVTDTIEGTGTESQWSVQKIGEADLLFISKHGLQSLGRVIQQRSAPLGTLTTKVRTEFLRDMQVAPANTVRSVLDPEAGTYVVTFPTQGRSWVFFFSRPYQDEVTGQQLYPITTWGLAPTAWLRHQNDKITYLGADGLVGRYAGSAMDDGDAFHFEYESGWLTMGEVDSMLKILKRMGAVVLIGAATTVTYKWQFDFSPQFRHRDITYESVGGAEWGEAEWGSAEWAGGLSLRTSQFSASGAGQFLKVGVEADIVSPFALQTLKLTPKIGRLV